MSPALRRPGAPRPRGGLPWFGPLAGLTRLALLGVLAAALSPALDAQEAPRPGEGAAGPRAPEAPVTGGLAPASGGLAPEPAPEALPPQEMPPPAGAHAPDRAYVPPPPLPPSPFAPEPAPRVWQAPRLWDVRSREAVLLNRLLRESRLPPLSGAGPLSTAELLGHLDQVALGRLSPAGRRAYTWLDRALRPLALWRDDAAGLAWRTTLNLAFEGWAGAGDVIERQWLIPWRDRPALLSLANEFGVGPAYFHFTFDARRDPIATGWLEQGASTWLNGLDELDGFFPSTGGFSLAIPQAVAFWERGRFSHGSGLTGGLMLSDEAAPQNYLGFTTFWPAFRLQSLVSDFDNFLTRPLGQPATADTWPFAPAQAQNGYVQPTWDPATGLLQSPRSLWLVAHNLEFVFFDQLRLRAEEAQLFTLERFELRYFQPFFLYHNWYLLDSYNPSMTLDLDWTPVAGLSLFASVLGDYITTPVKDAWFEDVFPLAMAYQAGFSAQHPLAEGWLTLAGETLWIDPFTYLDKTLDWTVNRRWLTNFRPWREASAADQVLVPASLGHPWGPDSWGLTLRLGYDSPLWFRAEFEYQFQHKGPNTFATPHPQRLFDADGNPTTTEQVKAGWAPDTRPSGSRHTWAVSAVWEGLSLDLGWDLRGGLSLSRLENAPRPSLTNDFLRPVTGPLTWDWQGQLGLVSRY